MRFTGLAALAPLFLLGACAGPTSRPFDPATAPAAIQPPPGLRVAFEAVARGKITYECQQDAVNLTQFDWKVVGPDAVLYDRNERVVGKYYGPPATWDNLDGSRVTGTQVATAPGGDGNIPLQLVKANPSTGNGAFTDTAYVQRVNTRRGVVPATTCNDAANGTRADVTYQADYIFWKAR